MSILHVTKDTYHNEVLKEEGTVLVDFWAPWCMPCRMLAPVLEQIAEESEEIKVCKINIDEEPELAVESKVMSIPTLAVMKNGKLVAKTVGVQTKNAILELIKA